MNSIILNKTIFIKNTFWSRLKGLLGQKELPIDEAILIVPSKQVHTFFMKFTILTIYLAKDHTILWIGVLKPWRIGPYIRHSYSILETSDLTLLKQLTTGQKLQFGVTSTNE